ncbi:MAG: OmpA family protein [Phocaeicola sp.]|nr:OmpA family protein [Phocaeicola sp.]
MQKGFLLCGLLFGSIAMQAQTVIRQDTLESQAVEVQKEKYVEARKNWFVGAGIGGHIHFSDHDKQMKLGDRITPKFEFFVGKWFNPYLGFRLGISGGTLKGLAGWDDHKSPNWNVNWHNYNGFITGANRGSEPGSVIGGTVYDKPGHSYPLYRTKIKYMHVPLDFMVNLSNILAGNNPDRFYSFIPYVGLGYAFTLNQSIDKKSSNSFTGNIGILNEFRLSKRLSLYLDLRGTLISDKFDQQIGGRLDGIPAASLGLTYVMNRKDNVRIVYVPTVQIVEKPVEKIVEVEKRVEIEKDCEPLYLLLANVTFDFDKYNINAKSAAILDQAAELLKKMPERRFLISGSTDILGDGKYNEALSARRAAAVVQGLEDRGVPTNMLKSRGLGNRVATLPASASESAREGDRKVTIELISNMEYWNELPKKSY